MSPDVSRYPQDPSSKLTQPWKTMVVSRSNMSYIYLQMVGLPFYFGSLDGKYVIISHDIPIKSWL